VPSTVVGRVPPSPKTRTGPPKLALPLTCRTVASGPAAAVVTVATTTATAAAAATRTRQPLAIMVSPIKGGV